MAKESTWAASLLLYRKDKIFRVATQYQQDFLLLGTKNDELLSFTYAFPLRTEEENLLLKVIEGVNSQLLKPKNRELKAIEKIPFPSNFTNLVDERQISWAISFGEATSVIGFTLWSEPYQLYLLDNVLWIKAHPLKKIVQNTSQEKNKLWNALCQLFNS